MFCVLLLNTITIRYFIWILIKECSFDSRGNIGYVVLEKKNVLVCIEFLIEIRA